MRDGRQRADAVFTATFSPTIEDGRAARAWVRLMLERSATSPRRRGDVALAAWELFTNAVLHAPAGPVRVVVHVEPGRVELAVTDAGGGQELTDTIGAGLGVVGAVSDGWHVQHLPDGTKTVNVVFRDA